MTRDWVYIKVVDIFSILAISCVTTSRCSDNFLEVECSHYKKHLLYRGAEDRILGEKSRRAQWQAERATGRVLQVAEAVLCADRAQGHAVLL